MFVTRGPWRVTRRSAPSILWSRILWPALSDARAIESLDLLFKLLAPEHMALVQTLAATGLVTLREAARRVGRDL